MPGIVAGISEFASFPTSELSANFQGFSGCDSLLRCPKPILSPCIADTNGMPLNIRPPRTIIALWMFSAVAFFPHPFRSRTLFPCTSSLPCAGTLRTSLDLTIMRFKRNLDTFIFRAINTFLLVTLFVSHSHCEARDFSDNWKSIYSQARTKRITHFVLPNTSTREELGGKIAKALLRQGFPCSVIFRITQAQSRLPGVAAPGRTVASI